MASGQEDSGSSLRAPLSENRDAFLLSAGHPPNQFWRLYLSGRQFPTDIVDLYGADCAASEFGPLSRQLSAVCLRLTVSPIEWHPLILSCTRAFLIRPRAGTEERCGLPSAWRPTRLLIRRNPWPVLEP